MLPVHREQPPLHVRRHAVWQLRHVGRLPQRLRDDRRMVLLHAGCGMSEEVLRVLLPEQGLLSLLQETGHEVHASISRPLLLRRRRLIVVRDLSRTRTPEGR